MSSSELSREAVGAMEITLDIRPETLHRFMAAHADLRECLGYVPPLEWFMAHALDSSNPAAVENLLSKWAGTTCVTAGCSIDRPATKLRREPVGSKRLPDYPVLLAFSARMVCSV